MKRLAMVAAASFLAMLLTGCGEGSKPADTNTDAAAQQTQDNAAQGDQNAAGGDQKTATDTQNQGQTETQGQ